MIRTIIGIIVAAIVIYAWGFVYWGFGPYYRTIWKQTADDAAASRALVQHFPERGTYFVPSGYDEQDEASRRFEQGPVAFVHMLAPEGRPMADPTIMGGGFALNLIVIVLVAIVLSMRPVAASTFMQKLGLVTLIGITSSILIDGGDAVWWQVPWQWKLYQAVYNASVWIIAGAILALFMPSRKAAEIAH